MYTLLLTVIDILCSSSPPTHPPSPQRSKAVLSVMLDIAAPHIIVPRDFDDKNTSMVSHLELMHVCLDYSIERLV